MIIYAIVLLFGLIWSYAAGAGALRDAAPFHSHRARTLRDAARRQSAPRATLETFRDPRLSPIIFASQPWHQRWWCEKLGVTSDALRDALQKVGPMTADVESHFALRKR